MLVHGVMGHASKQMIYEVYGKYTGGLGQDKLGVLQNFGRDSKQRAKGKPRPHAKIPARAGAFSPQPLDMVMICWSRRRDSKLFKHSTVQV